MCHSKGLFCLCLLLPGNILLRNNITGNSNINSNINRNINRPDIGVLL